MIMEIVVFPTSSFAFLSARAATSVGLSTPGQARPGPGRQCRGRATIYKTTVLHPESRKKPENEADRLFHVPTKGGKFDGFALEKISNQLGFNNLNNRYLPTLNEDKNCGLLS